MRKAASPSLAETDALIAKVRETGGFLSPVFQYRYGIGMAQFRAIQESGLAGRPLSARSKPTGTAARATTTSTGAEPGPASAAAPSSATPSTSTTC